MILSSVFVGASIFLWWIIRKLKKPQMIPTLHVLDLPTSKKPKPTLKVPSLIPFICFLLLSVLFLLVSFQPFQKLFLPTENTKLSVLYIVDLSPSIQNHIKIKKYRNLIRSEISKKMKNHKVNLITSAKLSPEEVTNDMALSQIVTNLKFHRSGFKLVTLLETLGDDLDEYSKIVVMSDLDTSNWQEINWDFVGQRTELSHFQVGESSGDLNNFFIEGVKRIENSSDKILSWRVNVSKNYPFKSNKGKIVATVNGEKVGKGKLKFDPLSLSSSAIIDIEMSKLEKASNGQNNVTIEFKFNPNKKDNLKLDNKFLLSHELNKGIVFLIGDPLGEQFLEDPAKQLSVAFEVNGYKVRRFDHRRQLSKKSDKSSIVVSQISGKEGDYCPSHSNRVRDRNIWLTPLRSDGNFSDLCQCARKVNKRLSSLSCSSVYDRNSFVKSLIDTGFDPVGGQAGINSSAPFFRFDLSSNYLLVSTIPLDPRAGAGVSHSKLPLLVKYLLKLSDSKMAEDAKGKRISDLTKELRKRRVSGENLVEISWDKFMNVPREESLLKQAKNLNSENSHDASSLSGMASSRYEKDSKGITDILISLVLMVLGIELFYFLGSLFKKTRERRKSSSSVMMIFFLIGLPTFLFSTDSYSYHNVSVVGKKYGSFNRLLKEVEKRTSIDMNKRSEKVVSLDNINSEYWVWTKGIGSITGSNRKLSNKVVDWVKSGGFLVIQGQFSKYQLDLLTNEAFPLERKKGKWIAVSPDHELMRSFYLLDSLPSCSNDVWYEFRYDSRTSILVIPNDFLSVLADKRSGSVCKGLSSREKLIRVFVNISMVTLTTDYKKDQIHLPEILKRLR
jgi:hypothetical protein